MTKDKSTLSRAGFLRSAAMLVSAFTLGPSMYASLARSLHPEQDVDRNTVESFEEALEHLQTVTVQQPIESRHGIPFFSIPASTIIGNPYGPISVAFRMSRSGSATRLQSIGVRVVRESNGQCVVSGLLQDEVLIDQPSRSIRFLDKLSHSRLEHTWLPPIRRQGADYVES